MEAMIEQYAIPLLRRVKKYSKNTRQDVVEDVYHNVIQSTQYFRCRHCGKFKAPTATECCEGCAKQLELFL
jgi:lipopolysaccharide biosynthesis regulator YciM